LAGSFEPHCKEGRLAGRPEGAATQCRPSGATRRLSFAGAAAPASALPSPSARRDHFDARPGGRRPRPRRLGYRRLPRWRERRGQAFEQRMARWRSAVPGGSLGDQTKVAHSLSCGSVLPSRARRAVALTLVGRLRHSPEIREPPDGTVRHLHCQLQRAEDLCKPHRGCSESAPTSADSLVDLLRCLFLHPRIAGEGAKAWLAYSDDELNRVKASWR
jgi:hypothetical protein